MNEPVVSRATHAAAYAAHRRRSTRRRVGAALRDTWVLMREFRSGLILFAVVIAIGTVSFRLLWNLSHEENLRLIEALFHVVTMTFLQPTMDFPREWYLDMYFFVMPVMGLVALARGLADFGTLLFNRNNRFNQWEEALASTYSNHVIIAGLGHLGIRVLRELVVLGEDIVAIELKGDDPPAAEARDYDIPVIEGDARRPDVLRRAGLDRASAVVICTNNDLSNLQIASRVRELNPQVRLVMRMFDDEFAGTIAERLDVAVMSSSGMSAPAFAGAASGTEIVQTFQVAGEVLAMGRIQVQAGSRLDGCVVSEIEHQLDLSIVLHQSGGEIDVHPPPGERIRAGDEVAVVGKLTQIRVMSAEWNRPNAR